MKQRHYILLAVLALLGIFNLVRYERMKHRPGAEPGVLTRGNSPAWEAYDKAAAARDTDDATFVPVLDALSAAIDTASAEKFPPHADAAELDGLRNCKLWLVFYRNARLHPESDKPVSLAQTKTHVDSCQARHRDVAR